MQARSKASVESILEATIQVLLSVGKARLTTARVATRAGVSVGTLYQYFPHKSALLQATLKRHLEMVTLALEEACVRERGCSVRDMAAHLVNAYLNAKMQDVKKSVALYQVSSDLDAAVILQQVRSRLHTAICGLLASGSEELSKDPQPIAWFVLAALHGVGRAILEAPVPESEYEMLRPELIAALSTYLYSCCAV